MLASGGVAAYLTGHEHVFQHHFAHGVHHVVCGASGAQPTRYYSGEDPDAVIDWADPASQFGFVVRCFCAGVRDGVGVGWWR